MICLKVVIVLGVTLKRFCDTCGILPLSKPKNAKVSLQVNQRSNIPGQDFIIALQYDSIYDIITPIRIIPNKF